MINNLVDLKKFLEKKARKSVFALCLAFLKKRSYL